MSKFPTRKKKKSLVVQPLNPKPKKRGRPKLVPIQSVYRLLIRPRPYVMVTRDQMYLPHKAKQSPDKMTEKEWEDFRRIERYNQYKWGLLQEAIKNNFKLPDANVGIIFFIPVSPSWSGAKKARHHMQPHHFKPDNTNLVKGFEDALRGKYTGEKDDSNIWNICASKRWVNGPMGWIEIHRLDNSWDSFYIQQYLDNPNLLPGSASVIITPAIPLHDQWGEEEIDDQ